jgi:hypothetical protein
MAVQVMEIRYPGLRVPFMRSMQPWDREARNRASSAMQSQRPIVDAMLRKLTSRAGSAASA